MRSSVNQISLRTGVLENSGGIRSWAQMVRPVQWTERKDAPGWVRANCSPSTCFLISRREAKEPVPDINMLLILNIAKREEIFKALGQDC